MSKIYIETDQEYLGRKFDIEKRDIARWIVEQCNSSVEEVEYLLDTAYPEGSYERFKDIYNDVLHHLEEEPNE